MPAERWAPPSRPPRSVRGARQLHRRVAIELVREVRGGDRVGRVAESLTLGPENPRRRHAGEGTLVEPEGDLLGDDVVDVPERRDHPRRAREEERLRHPRVVAEQLTAVADLTRVEEYERLTRQGRAAHAERVERHPVDEDHAVPVALRVVLPMDREVEQIRLWRTLD